MRSPRPQEVLVENFLNPNLEVIRDPIRGYRAKLNNKRVHLRSGTLELQVNQEFNHLYSYWQLLARYERSTGVLTILDPAKVYRSRTTQRHYGYVLKAINRFGLTHVKTLELRHLP